MMATTEGAGVRVEDAAEQAEAEQFWALVAADEELLNAQFEAIIAAEWPSPPQRAAGQGIGQQPPGEPGHAPTHSVRPPGCPARPGIDGWSRQRSPPATDRQPQTGGPVGSTRGTTAPSPTSR